MTLQLKIQLQNLADPKVWRQVQVPAQFSFYKLHGVIQAAFGWEHAHLFQFSSEGWGSKPEISLPYPDAGEDIVDAKKIKLKEVFKEEGQTYVYIYDFGDDWLHLLTLEKITDEKATKANCLAGEGRCPPEDCGGFPGYESLKEILNDPKHPEYADMREWLGLRKNQKWDAAAFDLKKANIAVQKV